MFSLKKLRDLYALLNLADKAGSSNALLSIRRFVTDQVFLTKAGHLGCVMRANGLDSTCLTDEILKDYSARIDAAMRSLSDDIRIYQHIIKRECGSIESRLDYHNSVVADTVQARNEAIQSRAGGLYRVDIYWTFLLETSSFSLGQQPKAISSKKVITLNVDRLKENTEFLLTQAQAFQLETSDLLAGILLGKDEAFGFIRRLCSPKDAQAGTMQFVPADAVDRFAIDDAITCHKEGIRIGQAEVVALSLREGLKTTAPNLLREVTELPCGVIICLEYKRLSTIEAVNVVANAESYFTSGQWLATLIGIVKLVIARGRTDQMTPDAAAKENIKEVRELACKLNAGDSLGKFSTTIILHGAEHQKLLEASAEAIKAFGRHQASLFRETYNALPTYLSIIPGNVNFNHRRIWMCQSSVADMSLIYAPAPGEKRNKHLGGEYLFVAETESHTPHFVNLHCDDVFGAFLSGATGAGKSVLSNLILDHLQKEQPRTCILDIGGSYRHTCRKHGGAYAHLQLSDQDWSINPFVLPRSKDNLQFLATFIQLLLTNNRYEPTYEDERNIFDAVGEMYEKPENERRLGNLRLPSRVKDALYCWIGSGQYGSVFDNDHDSVSFADFQVFDLQGMEDYPQVLEPLLFYIFRRQSAIVQDGKLRETFKVLWADEVWRFLANDTCRRQFIMAGKTYRKHNAGIGLVTQSSFDLKNAGLLEIISEVCPTKIFLSNPGANFNAYAEMFHLNAKEIENFRKLIPKRQFLMKKWEDPGVVLNLNLSKRELATYGNSPYENARRDAALEQFGWDEGMRVLETSIN